MLLHEGAVLSTYTLPYLPYLGMSDCTEGKYNCTTIGLLSEMMDILQSMLNFTLKVHMADSWGSVPAHGSFGSGDATFSGAMGAVINGTCELGLSIWGPYYERVSFYKKTLLVVYIFIRFTGIFYAII